MSRKSLPTVMAALAVLGLGLGACATQGTGYGYMRQGPRPVLYPNDQFRRMGPEQADADVVGCMQQADYYAPRQSQAANTAKNTLGGAAGGAALGAIGGAILGGDAGTGAAAGAAIGGAGGLMKSAVEAGQQDPNYRGWVEACLREKGYQVTGWQ